MASTYKSALYLMFLVMLTAVLVLSIVTVAKVYKKDDDKSNSNNGQTDVKSTTNLPTTTGFPTTTSPAMTTGFPTTTSPAQTTGFPTTTSPAQTTGFPTTTSPAQTTGFPTTTSPAQTREPEQIFHTNAPISVNDPRHGAYNDALKRFLALMNGKADACDDLYGYVCQKLSDEDKMPFEELQITAIQYMFRRINDANYREKVKNIPPMRQLFLYYDKCMDTPYPESKDYVITITKDFLNITGIQIPLFTNLSTDQENLSPKQLATAIGYLYGKYGIATFLTPYVDTNWKNPESGYLLFIDGATLMYDSNYYKKLGTEFLEGLKEHLEILARGFSDQMSDETLRNISYDIVKIVEMETEIAKNFTPTEAESRLFESQYNVYTLNELTEQYSFLDWNTLLKYVVYYGNDKVRQIINDQKFRVVITNKRYMQIMQRIANGNLYSQRTLINYFGFRLLNNYADLFLEDVSFSSSTKRYHPIIGKPRLYRTPKEPVLKKASKYSKFLTQYNVNCLYRTVRNFQYANGRLFIDAKYPRNATRTKMRENVAKFINSVIGSFRGMVDQLSWMDPISKLGAYDKMDNLVRNIGYPDFILNDDELTKYYSALTIDDTDEIHIIERKLFEFDMANTINMLIANTSRRDEFNGPPGIVNAWYQPEFNSITFPAAILDQPFFDLDWPASLNYGGLGVVAGHELTHGFDDEGVQWNGKGVLYQWLSDKSYKNFKDMAECVISEYSEFCPPYFSTCLNGEQTQGENIADNGGINAAYRAYKNFYSIYGQDPMLEYPLSSLTHDQLFFMGFTQVWCDTPSERYGSEVLLLTDPHSPSYYRVLGTVQNFPGFKNAFNCPAGSTYAPVDHCNVWVSDIDNFRGIPEDSNQKRNNVNIQPAEKLPLSDIRYKAYSDAAAMLRYSMNVSADPCTDFYSYACGNYNKSLSFTVLRNNNYRHIAEQMEKKEYENSPVESLLKTIRFYEACKKARVNYEEAKGNGEALISIMDEFSNESGLKFSIFEKTPETQTLTPDVLGKAIGLLSTFGVDTLITYMVDTDWKNPNSFKLFIDQNTLYYDKSYYNEGAWNTIKDNYKAFIHNLFENYAKLKNVNIDDMQLNDNIEKIFYIELLLARNYSTSDADRRQFNRSYVQLDTNFMFIDFASYVEGLAYKSGSELNMLIKNASKNAFNMEPKKISELDNDFKTKFNDTDIINYLFYRLLAEYRDFLPIMVKARYTKIEPTKVYLGRMKKRRIPLPREQDHDPSLAVKEQCAYETLNLMQYTNARFFADYRYPEKKDLDKMREAIKEIITNILTSFESMMRQTLKGDDKSIEGGYDKIAGIILNTAYPDFIFDNQLLDDYYEKVIFEPNDNYFEMRRKLLFFNYQLPFWNLKKIVDRHDFLGPPATANAWYQPELNSITFPDGVLMQPFFELNWPLSLNYGGLGVVAGHELSHGFDDEGVQWTGDGTLKEWMQEESKKKFDESANCIVKEYENFCPLDSTNYEPKCLNGENTQGENIADNGGIHAAWNSYKNLVDLNGEDPRLPDDVLRYLTHDQLFFLGFAQVWCQPLPSDEVIYRQIMTDPHSPSKYRVIGTVQNFPAFRNAFNCPRSSEEHCSVWVPKL